MKKLLLVLASLFSLAACATGGLNGSGAGGSGGAMGGEVEYLAPNVEDRVFFGFDSSDLSSDAKDVLGRQANWLKENPKVRVKVEGHADERGTREYNLALGERRAVAAKKFLTDNGVEASRVSVISYGKERPAAIGSSEEAWAKNRRAVTVVRK